MHVSPVTSPALSRRAVIIAAGLGLSATGCRITRDADGTGDGAPSTSSATSSPPDLEPDVGVASEALAQVRGLREALTATTTRLPDLASGLTVVSAMHAAHEASLVDAVPTQAPSTPGTRAYAVPRGRTAALARLAAAEKRLHTSLDALALRAESGDFARLLASMGAGVGQQLARWPR